MLHILIDRVQSVVGEWNSMTVTYILPINDIDHTKIQAMSLQTNGICEYFHKAILQECYQVTFRKKCYHGLEALQKNLGSCFDYYNNE